ncbi:MAG: protocatechuate 3,4-dioxygenase subunit alpha [Alphaproteobacteria bacterium]|nr:protocatechuate 3,4-dioxygenase subunit alpha [Alphaproteobacteria bacterium]
MSSPATASQTAGPFWHLIEFPQWADLTHADGPNAAVSGERITLAGRIADGAGAPVADALVEIWQAGPDGRYDGAFHGFGRAATDRDGGFRFRTLRPGPVPGRGNALQAPHVTIAIFARGLQKPLFTRLYFAGDSRNQADPVLTAVDPARRNTMIATDAGEGLWRLDIRLQGEGETVFLDI